MADDLDANKTDPLEGRYANCFQVGHNAFEFLLDFGQLYGTATVEVVHTRIITGPSYAKALHETLGESLARYEHEFGALTLARAAHDATE